MVERNISMKKEDYGVNVLILGHRCHRCHHAWVPRDIGQIPEICPNCKSPYWKTQKRIFKKGEKKKDESKK